MNEIINKKFKCFLFKILIFLFKYYKKRKQNKFIKISKINDN